MSDTGSRRSVSRTNSDGSQTDKSGYMTTKTSFAFDAVEPVEAQAEEVDWGDLVSRDNVLSDDLVGLSGFQSRNMLAGSETGSEKNARMEKKYAFQNINTADFSTQSVNVPHYSNSTQFAAYRDVDDQPIVDQSTLSPLMSNVRSTMDSIITQKSAAWMKVVSDMTSMGNNQDDPPYEFDPKKTNSVMSTAETLRIGGKSVNSMYASAEYSADTQPSHLSPVVQENSPVQSPVYQSVQGKSVYSIYNNAVGISNIEVPPMPAIPRSFTVNQPSNTFIIGTDEEESERMKPIAGSEFSITDTILASDAQLGFPAQYNLPLQVDIQNSNKFRREKSIKSVSFVEVKKAQFIPIKTSKTFYTFLPAIQLCVSILGIALIGAASQLLFTAAFFAYNGTSILLASNIIILLYALMNHFGPLKKTNNTIINIGIEFTCMVLVCIGLGQLQHNLMETFSTNFTVGYNSQQISAAMNTLYSYKTGITVFGMFLIISYFDS